MGSKQHILATAWCHNCDGLLICGDEKALLAHIDPIAFGIEAFLVSLLKIFNGSKKRIFIVTNAPTERNQQLIKIVQFLTKQGLTCEVKDSSMISFDLQTNTVSFWPEQRSEKLLDESSCKNMFARNDECYNFAVGAYLSPCPNTKKLDPTYNFGKDFCDAKFEASWIGMENKVEAHKNITKLMVQHLHEILSYEKSNLGNHSALAGFFKVLDLGDGKVLLEEIQKSMEQSQNLKEPNNTWIEMAKDRCLETLLDIFPSNIKSELLIDIEKYQLTTDKIDQKISTSTHILNLIQKISFKNFLQGQKNLNQHQQINIEPNQKEILESSLRLQNQLNLSQ